MTIKGVSPRVECMCDTALEVIQGVSDDLGAEAALSLFRAQIAAAAVAFGRAAGDLDAGVVVVMAEVSAFAENVEREKKRLRKAGKL